MSDTWDPAQYNKFEREREQPFFDLLAFVHRRSAMRVVDLGCGTGRLTRGLHEQLEARETVGIDRSNSMLAGEGRRASPRTLVRGRHDRIVCHADVSASWMGSDLL
jgi:trans-aconitate 2-methyltransferase